MLGLRSRGLLHKHVQALIQAGFVAPIAGQHRGIRLFADEPTDDGIPFLGKIAAGRPIEALPQLEQIQVPLHLRTDKPCYVLQVVGDSMREAGILDGDYVVIEQRDHARNGEIVVALVRGEEATLKRILQEPGARCSTRKTAPWQRWGSIRTRCRSGACWWDRCVPIGDRRGLKSRPLAKFCHRP